MLAHLIAFYARSCQVKAQGSPFNWDYYAPNTAGFSYRFWNSSFLFEGAPVGPPVVPFGFGLSYTSWSYSNLSITPASTPSAPLPGCSMIAVSAQVCNLGSVDSDEVTQVCKSYRSMSIISFFFAGMRLSYHGACSVLLQTCRHPTAPCPLLTLALWPMSVSV